MTRTNPASLAKTTTVYGITNAIFSVVPLVLLPILTRYFSQQDYGILENFMVLMEFVVPIVGMSVHSAIFRQYYERESISLPRYIGNGLGILMVNAVVASLILLLLAGPVARVTGLPGTMLWCVIVAALGNKLTEIILVIWRAEYKPVSFGAFRILQSLLCLGLSLGAVVWLGRSWQGRVEAEVITFAAMGIAGLVLLRAKGLIKLSFDRGYVVDAVKFGAPLIIQELGVTIRTMTDRWFISAMVGLADTGLYAVGYKVGRVIGFVESSFNMAWVPWFFDQLKGAAEGSRRRIVKYTYIYGVVIMSLALLLSLAAPWFMRTLVGDTFAASQTYIVWIAFGYAFNGMYKMACNYMFYVKKTFYLSLVTAITAILNLVLNYVMIRGYGPIGAAQATTITLGAAWVLTWILAQWLHPMPWTLRK